MCQSIRLSLAAVVGWLVLGCFTPAGPAVCAAADFDADVASIFVRRCLECHKGREPSGGLDLATRAAAMRGGESGVAIHASRPEDSLLLQRVAAGEMPPEQQKQSQKIPDAEIALLREWIAAGAVWPSGRTLDLYEATTDVRGGRDWWSLQKVQRPQVPKVSNTRRVVNPIDAFILSRLEAEGVEPAPIADRRTLVRRLYNDLLGLPPTHEQIETFVADESPDAWLQLIDELLKSPHYGERWARYWLDVARFAETSGYERDQEKPFAWKYRDWVVEALNSDMPYDRFIIEQLAGDELPDRTKASVIGTGFLRLGTWNDEPNDGQDYKYDRLEDLVHTTSSAFLGLTVKCARCHDHKFDPIPQVDYYRIAAAFWPGSIEPDDRKLLGGPSPEALGFADVLGWTDLGTQPSPLHVLKNGSRHQPQETAEPGPLSAVPAMFHLFEPPPEGAKTTRRRLQLAKWIARADNPLTARVMVNRLWQHHFGEGLVRSPNNFGFRGDQPTHRELLDWLAAEFVSSGWKIKHIHRLILQTNTWRQSSLHPKYEEYAERDFTNRLWWRSQRRRLDAESLRDAMLAVSGDLDPQLGGPSFRPTITADALEGLSRKASAWTASPEEDQRRRSLYIYTKRHLLPPMMTAFDFADTTLSCAQRNVTTVAPQALGLLNNHFPHARSTALAKRVIETAGESQSSRIKAVWQFALGRNPTSDEADLASQHLASQRKRFEDQQKAADRAEVTEPAVAKEVVRDGLVLHLRASVPNVEYDPDGNVARWLDLSGRQHHASQAAAARRPDVVEKGIGGQPAIRFDGKRRFLTVQGKLLTKEACTIVAIATDQGPAGHREIISNWNSSNNSTTSIFLGLTAEKNVRFSDVFNPAGQVVDRQKPFMLTAVNSSTGAAVYQNTGELAARASQLGGRNLKTPWVIGQQGNIDGEYWHGDVAEILVYDRALEKPELQQVWNVLIARYMLPARVKATLQKPADPQLLALASLCHVLLNSNEFIYVD